MARFVLYSHKSSIFASVFALLVLSLPAYGFAATSLTGTTKPHDDKSIIVSPFLSETNILASDTTKDISINLTNNTGHTQSFIVTALDFGSLDDTGGIVFAGNSDNKLIAKYGLANWIRLPKDHITLKSGESTKLQATIVNEPTLGPGGHYASIIMTVDNSAGEGSQIVSVKQKISALIFATKVGGEVYDLQLAKIKYDGSLRQLPKIITLDFKNTGNVHVVPRGTIRLISPSGHVVSRGVINEASAFVLPETSRQLIVQIEPIKSHSWESGTYKLQVDYRYDGYDQFASKTLSLQYYNFIGIIFVFIVLFVVALAGYKLLRGETVRNQDDL